MIEQNYEELINLEKDRQFHTVELIASENFPSDRILAAAGSCLTNKYAEGYSGKRYYGGCEFIDMIETKAIEDACELFHVNFANVQPHCGSSANQAVYRAFCKSGDTVLGMDLGAGGHLTHGHKMSFSGQDYNIVSYGVTKEGVLDYEDLNDKLNFYNPRLLIVGASSYSRKIDYERIRDYVNRYNNILLQAIRDVYNKGDFYESESDEKLSNEEIISREYDKRKCIYMVDMAHVAGLVAAGVHPDSCMFADVVTSTTHKTLRGPRGGLILWNDADYTKRINSAVFPGVQGGPLEHIIAAKGICFEEANTPEFKNYAAQVIINANAFANAFIDLGYDIVSGGTENHMFVLNVYKTLGLTGKEIEIALDKIHITVNKNQIPNDELPPLKSSGVRIGTAAMTTKGWIEEDFVQLASIIDNYLRDSDRDNQIEYYSSLIEEMINNITNRVNE